MTPTGYVFTDKHRDMAEQIENIGETERERWQHTTGNRRGTGDKFVPKNCCATGDLRATGERRSGGDRRTGERVCCVGLGGKCEMFARSR